MANFLWNSNNRIRKRWVSWDVVCRPMSEEGLGIRPLPQIMTALHAKRYWSLIQGKSVWAHYMLRKYGDPRDSNYIMPNAPSPLWHSMLSVFYKVFDWIVGEATYRFGVPTGATQFFLDRLKSGTLLILFKLFPPLLFITDLAD